VQIASPNPTTTPQTGPELASDGRLRRWWTDRPLGTKGWVVLSIPVVMLCLGTLVLYLQGRREEQAVQQVQHSYEVQSTLQQIDLLLLGAESSIRGFLIDGNQTTLAEFTSMETELPRTLEALTLLIDDNPAQAEQLALLRTKVDQRLASLRAVRDASLAEGVWPSTVPEEVRAMASSARAEVRQLLATMQAEEVRLLAQRSDHEQRSRSRARLVLLAMLGFGLGGSLLATTLFTSGIAGRVHRLAANADRLAVGESLDQLPPANDEIGQLAEHMMTASDLLRQRETALAHERDLLSALMDNIPYPVFFKDRQSRFIRVNAATARLTGSNNPDDFVGKTDFDFLPAETVQPFYNREQALMETGKAIVNRISTMTWADGHVRWGLDNKAPIFDREGTVIGLVGSSADITSMKLAEEATARLAAIVESSNDAIIGTTLEGTITSWNSGAERLYGYPAVEAIGHIFTELLPPDADADNKFARKFAKIATGLLTEPFESTQQTKSGRTVDVSLTFSPVYDAEKTTIGVAVIARDISARKQAEADLLAANKELEAFTYSVSHDLRAPLRAMNGFSRILLEDYEADIPVDARHFLQLIQDNARQMGQLVDDLLAFSRLGRQALVKVPVALDQLAREVIADLRPDWEGRAVTLSVDTMPVVDVDPGLMRQVFANLIGNALKFTRKRDAAEIEVAVVPGPSDAEEITIQVRDNGVGFDMTYAHKLFGVFQRLHRAEDYDGTGVGLALVQRIIHRHGGEIWAEAEVNQGATFFFTLPRNLAQPSNDTGSPIESRSESGAALAV
jgi:PAS domain S-box-containing protein